MTTHVLKKGKFKKVKDITYYEVFYYVGKNKNGQRIWSLDKGDAAEFNGDFRDIVQYVEDTFPDISAEVIIQPATSLNPNPWKSINANLRYKSYWIDYSI